jgi:lysyl endopeptidase
MENPMIRFDQFTRAFVCALVLGLFGSWAFADSNSPGAPAVAKAAAAPSFLLSSDAPAVALQLDPINPVLVDSAKRANAKAMNKRLQIGIGRDVAPELQASSEALLLTPVAGGLAARLEVTSPGATALRVALASARIAPGIELRFAGSARPDTVYGPFTARDVDRSLPSYWSPVLEGDTAIVELYVSDGASVLNRLPAVTQISHLFVSPADPKAEGLAKIGESGSCEVNLICRSASDTALANAGRAVARMVFQETPGGGSFLCTGTLLNPLDGSFTPYFYTAAHCISTQASASTLTTHWFYDSTSCGSNILSPSYTQLPGGATLLFANTANDPSFMRLNATPPNGANWAGWDSTTLSGAPAMTAVHHPMGDLKKVSLGTFGGFNGGDESPSSGNTFIIVNWNSFAGSPTDGITEPGSSGSGIFTAFGSPVSQYRLRGGLQGGPSLCSATGSDLQDYYSRFDLAYPSISQYLGSASTGTTNYTALYWNPNESGWGINFNHQGDIIFATLFDYDTNGQPMWLVSTMTKQSSSSGSDVFSGDLLRTTGPAFNANPFTPIDASNVTTVGAMAIALSGNDGGLSYTVNGANVTKSITKQQVGPAIATCVGSTADRSSLTNYQDLWWAGQNESGWGINLTHDGNTIFATLFTYASAGQGTHNPGAWYVSTATRQSDGSYQGNLLSTTGPAFNANPFTPITGANITTVGQMRFTFSNGTTGAMTYNVGGAFVSKTITRQVFGSGVPRPACTS